MPVARLVKIEPPRTPGARFLAAHGTMAGKIIIGDDFEFTDDEIDEMIDQPL